MATAKFTVSLDQPAAERAFVKWATVDGSASAQLTGRPDVAYAEYTAARGYAIFEVGQSQATVEIEVSDNVSSPQSLTFHLVLFDAYGCVPDTAPVPCVISYNGSTEQAPDDIAAYAPADTIAPVDPINDYALYLSFSGPENARWGDQQNVLNRFASWPTENYARYYGQAGLRYMRLCSAYDLTQQCLWGDPDPVAQRMLRKSVALFGKYGIKSFISQHSNSMFSIEGCVASFGDGVFTECAYADTMQKIMRLVQDLPDVVCMALNSEPLGSNVPGQSDAVWWRYAAVGLSAVRQVNRQMMVAIDSGSTGTLWNWPDHNSGLATLRDPAARSLFVSDIYLDSGTGSMASFWDEIVVQGDAFYYGRPVDATLGPRRLDLIKPWLAEYGWRLMVGETACGWYDAYNQPGAEKWIAACDAYARACLDNKYVLGVWTAGNDFDYVYNVGNNLILNRYPYTTDPVGSSNRYGPYMEGPEAPPFTAYKRWFGPAAEVYYALQTSISVNGASCAVQIATNFDPPTAFTAAIDDAGAGGSVAGGNAIAFDAGAAQTRVATYTGPAGTCVATLGLTATIYAQVKPATQKVFFDVDMFGTLGLAPVLVIWPVRLVPGYAGPCVTLLRSDQGATRAFGFAGGGSPVQGIGAAVDVSAVDAWDAGTPLVVRYHDQSGNGRDLGPYRGEDCQWSEDGSKGPASTPADYPRYMLARDVPYRVPHFGADFGVYDRGSQRANRMDAVLPIDGALDYSWIVAFGATVAIGQDDYVACLSYSGTNFIVGPNGVVQAAGATTARGDIGLRLNNLNIVEVYYSGGALLRQDTGSASNTTITMPDGTVIVADLDKQQVSVKPPGGSATVYSGAVTYPGDQYDVRWTDSAGHYNHLLSGWGGSGVWSVTDGQGTLKCRLNGTQTVSLPASGFLVDPYNGILNVCWNRFFLSVTVADFIGIIAIPGAVTDAQRDVIYHSLRASLAS